MRMRKLFAGLAATATLLGGLTFATSAQADENVSPEEQPVCEETTLTLGKTVALQSSDKNQLLQSNGDYRDYKYIKLADLQLDSTNKHVIVTTSSDDTVLSAIKAALKSSTAYDAEQDGDPMSWVGQHLLSDNGVKTEVNADKDASVRKFVDALGLTAENATVLPKATESFDNTTGITKLTYTLPDSGIYLIFDASGTQVIGNKSYAPSKNMLLSTVITAAEASDGKVACKPGNSDGVVNVKPGSESSTLHEFNFMKIDKNYNGIANAQFAIKNSNGDWLKYENGAWVAADENTRTVIKSDDKGLVPFPNLAPGTYTIVETKVAQGYLDYKASFTVTVAEDGGKTISTNHKDDPWNLVNDANYPNSVMPTVLNVKTVPDLPMTGAAGTILFTVVGVLLAAAAATVFAKSRFTKRQLAA